MKCEFLKNCPFFNCLTTVAVKALKEVYCRENPALCARLQVASAVGRENVPPDLTPNHNHLVQSIIEKVLSER
jgi:hypothetical protein